MKATDFAYWLQGFFELRADRGAISAEQAAMIERHLALVFKHDLDPAVDGGDPAKAAALQTVHDGPRPQVGGVGPGGTVYRC